MKLQSDIRFLIFTVLIFVSGCNHKNEVIYTHTVSRLEDKIIKLDTLTDPMQVTYSLYDGKNKRKLFLISAVDNSLQQYDWDSGELLNKKKLPIEGPNGVGTAGYVEAKSEDSIFVLSGFEFKLFLLDRDYSVKKSYFLLDNESEKPKIGSGVFARGKFFVYKNKVYTGGYPFMDRDKENFYKEGINTLSVDIASGKVSYLTKSPPDYLKKFNDGFIILPQHIDVEPTFNFEKNQMVLNFISLAKIEVYDIESKKSTFYHAGSSIVDDIVWPKKSLYNDRERRDKHLIANPLYSSIVFDSYRRVYYRMLDKPNPRKVDEYDGIQWTIPSLIILDENFNKIGETEIPEDYSLSNMIPTDEGLYIRKNIKDEDKIIFTLFKLVRL